MAKERNAWLSTRGRGIHLTIRDIDCRDFDVDAMVRAFVDCRVSFFSFFAGGYVTTYPTALEFQRMSPWLDGRDLVGEIVSTAHGASIRAIPMIDLAMLPEHAWRAHPEWGAVGAAGAPVMRTEGLYASCPMGGYVREYSRAMVAELVERYEIDGVKFGGGSYGFGRSACHCQACTSAYEGETGRRIPTVRDWTSPEWRRYVHWRTTKTAQVVRHLADIVHGLRPDLPMMGNAVCFGDPHWTVGCSLDIEQLAGIQDAVQVEIQTRAWNAQPEGEAYWQYLRWSAETAAYMTAVTSKPIWAVTSYFYAWPWRRVSAPAVEQKVYLAQAVAHGASPMVNLSGGPAAVHEDPRGFAAIRELYTFMAEHEQHIDGDESCAEVALVYDQDTLMYYGNDSACHRYVEEMRGFEDALHRAHVPFDIISTRTIAHGGHARYRCLVLPNAACIGESAPRQLEGFVEAGGGLVASFETGLYDSEIARRPQGVLDKVLGIAGAGDSLPCVGSSAGAMQAYQRRGADHDLAHSLADCELLPLSGEFRPVRSVSGSVTVYHRTQPFRVFPEGWSYPVGEDPAEPTVVARTHPSGGRTAYLASQAGRVFWQSRYPDLAKLLSGAVTWAHRGPQPLSVNGPPTLHTSLRRKAGNRMVHCINLTGGERFFTELVPLHDSTITLRSSQPDGVTAATLLSDGVSLPVVRGDYTVSVTVPRLADYDIVLFEADAEETWNT